MSLCYINERLSPNKLSTAVDETVHYWKNVMEKQQIIHFFIKSAPVCLAVLLTKLIRFSSDVFLSSCSTRVCCPSKYALAVTTVATGVYKSTMMEILRIITSTGHCKAIAALHHTTWDQRRKQPTNLKMYLPNCLTLIVTLRQNNKCF